jgi:ligand-binding SRPBCC domain-containing protein
MDLHYEQVVPWPAAAVFAFFENPANLEIVMGGRNQFRLLEHAPLVRPGATVWCEVRLAGCVPVVFGFRHTIYEPPLRFGEELIHGPFKSFRHIHEFHPTKEGTLIKDMLTMALPFAYGGEVMTRWLIAPIMNRAFAMRHQRLRGLMKAPPGDEVVKSALTR